MSFWPSPLYLPLLYFYFDPFLNLTNVIFNFSFQRIFTFYQGYTRWCTWTMVCFRLNLGPQLNMPGICTTHFASSLALIHSVGSSASFFIPRKFVQNSVILHFSNNSKCMALPFVFTNTAMIIYSFQIVYYFKYIYMKWLTFKLCLF